MQQQDSVAATAAEESAAAGGAGGSRTAAASQCFDFSWCWSTLCTPQFGCIHTACSPRRPPCTSGSTCTPQHRHINSPTSAFLPFQPAHASAETAGKRSGHSLNTQNHREASFTGKASIARSARSIRHRVGACTRKNTAKHLRGLCGPALEFRKQTPVALKASECSREQKKLHSSCAKERRILPPPVFLRRQSHQHAQQCLQKRPIN